MNDSDVKSPPTKRLKQAGIIAFVQNAKDSAPIEIEKENQPQQNGDTITGQPSDDCQMVVSETQSNNEPPSTPKSSNNKSMTTPKSGRKRTREEVEVAKAEKEKKRNERKEKAELRKKQLEAEKQKREEQRAKEKAEREEKKAKELAEKEQRQKAQAEQKAKRDEEKRQQAEEKAKRLQEKEDIKRKKDEEKLREEKLKEEARLAEEAKKKEAENKFKSFFSGKKRIVTTTKVTDCSKWSKFEPKPNQSLAPINFYHLSTDEMSQLDLCLRNSTPFDGSYLGEIRQRAPRTRSRQRITKNDDVKLINPELEVALKQGARMKLLQFHRNYRPAFYGTFRRKVKINGRRPYHKDTDCFNYEFDSDDEWEEPEEGEDCAQNEEQSDDDTDEDETDGMIVPHGYLSSDEEQHDENDGELFQSSSDRQKSKQAAYEKMRKKKLKKLEIKVKCNNGQEPILILSQQHFPVNPLHDYVTVVKPKTKKKPKKEKPKKEKNETETKQEDADSETTEKKKDPETKQPETPKATTTPKTPKSVSILNFAKKVADSEGLRTQLFNDSKRAQQRQEVKKKQEQIKQEEAKKKAEEIKKAKLAAEQAKTTESSNGVNVLTPKRKKKVAIRTLSTGSVLGPVGNGHQVEKKSPQAAANKQRQTNESKPPPTPSDDDVITIE